jgi:hypothetical protein
MQARDFYEKAKQEQKEGRFFPERNQQGGMNSSASAFQWRAVLSMKIRTYLTIVSG